MKKINILLIIIILFTLTSCYDQKELNKIAILTATEINKKDTEFIINAKIVNSQKQDDEKQKYITYQGKGKTIQDAYRQIKLSSPKYIYPEHLEILIIDEEIAKNNINEILDFYLRNPIIRTEFYVIISKNDNILNQTNPTSITNTLKTNNKYQGVSSLITFNDFTNMKLNPNQEIVLPSIMLDDENQYKISGLAIFKNNKLINYLTNEESITYNMIKNNTTNTIINYQCENNKYISIETTNTNAKIKIKNDYINIYLDITANINESNCNIKLNNNQELQAFQKKLETYFNNKISNDINTIRWKYNTDIFGFLDEIYKHNYNTYKKVKNNWHNSIFKSIPINVETKIDIVGKGNIMENIYEKN